MGMKTFRPSATARSNAACSGPLSVCCTTHPLAPTGAGSVSVTVLPSIFRIVLISWSRPLKVTRQGVVQSRLPNFTSTPPLSFCHSPVTGTLLSFQVRARSSLQRKVGGVVPAKSSMYTVQLPRLPS